MPFEFSVAIQFNMKVIFFIQTNVRMYHILFEIIWIRNKAHTVFLVKKKVAPLMAFGVKHLRHIILQVLHTELQISLVEFSGKHLCLLDLPASIFRVEISHRLSQNDLRPDQAQSLWFYFWLWHFSLIMVCQIVLLCHPQSQNLHFWAYSSCHF